MLAEWPDSLTERAINESAVVMAEHAEKRQFDKLSHDDVKLKIASAVSKKCGSGWWSCQRCRKQLRGNRKA